jgi:shikimate kinase
MKQNNIILIGFMGVGKGTIGRELSNTYNLLYLDTDDIIENQQNMKIKKIFQNYGEEYFRNLEQICANFINKNIDNSIISTGGGFYSVDNLKNMGKIIYLESSFQGIISRINKSDNYIKKIKKRPLLQDLYSAKRLFESRVNHYKSLSDFIIDVEDQNIESIVNDIKNRCEI